MKIDSLFDKFAKSMSKHLPEILIALGLTELITGSVLTVKSTLNAKEKCDTYKQVNNKTELSKKEIVKITWRNYIAPVSLVVVGAASVIGGNVVSAKRNAAITAAYVISNATLQKFQDKTAELAGDKKAQQIKEAVSSASISKSYDSSKVLVTGDGDCLFYEPLTDRYFKSNWNKILACANELNADALSSMSCKITLSEWFYALGLPATEISDEMGWQTFNGSRELINISMSSHVTNDNVPCGAIQYDTRPQYF